MKYLSIMTLFALTACSSGGGDSSDKEEISEGSGDVAVTCIQGSSDVARKISGSEDLVLIESTGSCTEN